MRAVRCLSSSSPREDRAGESNEGLLHKNLPSPALHPMEERTLRTLCALWPLEPERRSPIQLEASRSASRAGSETGAPMGRFLGSGLFLSDLLTGHEPGEAGARTAESARIHSPPRLRMTSANQRGLKAETLPTRLLRVFSRIQTDLAPPNGFIASALKRLRQKNPDAAPAIRHFIASASRECVHPHRLSTLAAESVQAHCAL
jgi:hypothetical protein